MKNTKSTAAKILIVGGMLIIMSAASASSHAAIAGREVRDELRAKISETKSDVRKKAKDLQKVLESRLHQQHAMNMDFKMQVEKSLAEVQDRLAKLIPEGKKDVEAYLAAMKEHNPDKFAQYEKDKARLEAESKRIMANSEAFAKDFKETVEAVAKTEISNHLMGLQIEQGKARLIALKAQLVESKKQGRADLIAQKTKAVQDLVGELQSEFKFLKLGKLTLRGIDLLLAHSFGHTYVALSERFSRKADASASVPALPASDSSEAAVSTENGDAASLDQVSAPRVSLFRRGMNLAGAGVDKLRARAKAGFEKAKNFVRRKGKSSASKIPTDLDGLEQNEQMAAWFTNHMVGRIVQSGGHGADSMLIDAPSQGTVKALDKAGMEQFSQAALNGVKFERSVLLVSSDGQDLLNLVKVEGQKDWQVFATNPMAIHRDNADHETFSKFLFPISELDPALLQATEWRTMEGLGVKLDGSGLPKLFEAPAPVKAQEGEEAAASDGHEPVAADGEPNEE